MSVIDLSRSAPPGFGVISAQRNTAPNPFIQNQSRIPPITPVIPQIPPPGLTHGAVTPEQTPQKLNVSAVEPNNTTEGSQASAVLSHSRLIQAKESHLPDEEFPALGAPKANKTTSQHSISAVSSVPTPKATPLPKRQNERTSDKDQQRPVETVEAHEAPSSTRTDSKSAEHNAQKLVATALKSNAELAKSDRPTDPTVFPPLPTPSTTNSPSPAHRTVPKTLRVVPPILKAEVHSVPPTAPAAISTVASVASKSISASQRPGTPASEMISDTASVVSASVSVSRAGSPPPSKIGSALVRGTTKSQQRKQRREALKQETKIMAEAPKLDSEEHAPVIGRKKKQKKEKPIKEAAAHRHATALAQESVKEEAPVSDDSENLVESAKEVGQEVAKGKAGSPKKSGKLNSPKEKEKEHQRIVAPRPASPLPKDATSSEVYDPTERPQPSPTSVFADIRKSLWTSALDKLQILKPVSSNNSKSEHGQASPLASKSGSCKDCPCRCGDIQPEDLAALRAGKPVRKQFHVDGSRMLITPHGDCIRGLTPEEEEAFLALQAAIATTAENPGAFVAPRHQPSSGAFSLIKGRAVPNGRPNIFPSTAQPQSQDPIGKLQREDALSYINQYVLPRLSLGASSTGSPKGSSPRDSAAASLNSLAPYFYGPDAAAGVGIYSAPDGARALQDFASPGYHSEEVGKSAANGVGNMPLMGVDDAEAALTAAKRETEKLEKGLNAVIKRNRRLLLGGGN